MKTVTKKGFILEVDLEYPTELHDLHNDHPVAAEKIKVTKDTLSPYYEKIRKNIICPQDWLIS